MPSEGIIAVEGWEYSPGVAYNNSVYYYDDPEGEGPWFDNQTEHVRSGKRAMRFRPTDEFGDRWGGAAIATPIVWAGEVSGSVRVYFQFGILPTSGKAEVAFFSWETSPVRLTTKVYYDPADGRLHMHQSTDQNWTGNDRPDTYGISDEGLWPPDYVSGDAVEGPLIVAGRWYLLEMRWADWNPNRRAEWRVDGVDYPSIEHVKAEPDEYQWVLFFWVGSASPSACELYIDDLLQSGNYPSDGVLPDTDPPLSAPNLDPLYPLGPGYVLGYRPNACGTHNDPSNRLQDADGSNIDANSWQGLDEIPPNPAASWDGIKQVTVDATAYAEILFEDCHELWPIVAIDSLAAMHRLSAGVGFLSFKLQYDGAEFVDTEPVVRPEPDFWENLFLGLDTHGGDSSLFALADLTVTKFNALAMRVGYSTDVTPVPALDALLLQVAFSTANPIVADGSPREIVRGTPAHVIASSGRTR